MSRKTKSPPKGPAPEGVIPKESQARSDSITNRHHCQERRRRRIDQNDIQKPAYWAVLPAQVRYDPELPPNAKLLYAEISSLTDQTGYCFASNAYFQNLYALSKRTIQNLLAVLRQRGYIQIADETGGSQTRKIYAGINPLAQTQPVETEVPHAENCTGGCKKLHGGHAEICTHNKKDNRKDNNTPQSPPGGRRVREQAEWMPEEFERFWKSYPRGDDKKAARREWDRLKPDHELIGRMSAVLDRMKQTDEWRRGIGIPYMCRWLSHRRWEDEERESVSDPDTGGYWAEDPEVM